MFCEHCGKQIDDNSAFCEHCGTRFDNASQPASNPAATEQPPVTPASPAPKKAPPAFLTKIKDAIVGVHKKNKFILPACALGLVAIIVGIILLVGFLNQVPLKDFCKIEATGYNGFSEFVCDLDETSILLRAMGVENCEEYGDYKYYDEDELEEIYEKFSKDKNLRKSLEKFGESLEIEYKLPEGKEDTTLSNGDKIEITITCDEDAAKELGVDFKGGTFTYEVSGLKDVDLIDILSYFDIKYTGFNGYARATLVCNKTEDVTKGDYTFKFKEGESKFIYKHDDETTNVYPDVYPEDDESYSNLSNGDKLTLSVGIGEYTNSEFLEEGFAVGPLKKTVEVAGLEEPQEFDLLQYYTPSYSGINGDASVTLVPTQEEVTVGSARFDLKNRRLYNSDGSDYTYFYFDFSDSYDLTNGDEITVTLDYYEDDFAKFGIIVTSEEKTITAAGLYEYVTSLSQISSVKDSIVEIAKTTVSDDVYDDWDYMVHHTYGSYSDTSITNITLYKTILLTSKSSNSAYNNELYLVFSATVSDSETEATTKYFAVYESRIAYGSCSDSLMDEPYFYTYRGYDSYQEFYDDYIADTSKNIEVE